MPKGILYCPKCYQPGMDTYDFYEYAILNDGKEGRFIMNKNKSENVDAGLYGRIVDIKYIILLILVIVALIHVIILPI